MRLLEGRAGGLWRVHPAFCWQDVAGTVPAGVGDPVGRWDDVSGRGLPFTQATATARPTLQQDADGRYMLSGDGVDDMLATPAIDFSGSDKMLVVSIVRNRAATATGRILELSPLYSSNNGSFLLIANSGTIANYGAGVRGAASADRRIPVTGLPRLDIITARFDLAAATRDAAIMTRFNGATWTASSGGVIAAPGGGNFGNYSLYTFLRGLSASTPLLGDIYGHFVIGGLHALEDALELERFAVDVMGGMPA